MPAKLKKDKREPVRIQLKKNDQVKVIAGRDRGKTGRVLDVISATGPHSGRARQHDQEAHEEEPGETDCGRYRRKGSADRGFERDDPVREVRTGPHRTSCDGSCRAARRAARASAASAGRRSTRSR